ncbi:MAG: purine-nucleoside phosphorylase [Elusimicrobia bacterium]|nr:purine-nucleoside phosphorylase [Elusimicrobiota bacterium]
MDADKYLEQIRAARERILALSPGAGPVAGVILGSGLSSAVPPLEESRAISCSEIPGFPRATVAGHEGKLILGRYRGSQVAVLQGRFHYYEGHSMAAVALPVRVLASLGLKTLILTSAVGSVRPALKPGHLAVLKDHINLMGANPLRGFHQAPFGEMFPDLADAYDFALRRRAMAACRKRKIPAREGIYLAVSGPSYETPAEIRAFRRFGADVVGMSVVPEVLVARQQGVKVLALCWVSNMASGLTASALSHPEVLALGQKMSGKLAPVIEELLKSLPSR